jgi:hypothetical protein
MSTRGILHAAFIAMSAYAAPAFAEEVNERNCRQIYDRVDRVVLQANVRDAQDFPIKGYPYLRSNRFFASVAQKTDSALKMDFLLRQWMALDQRARQLELKNLPVAAYTELEQTRRTLFPNQIDFMSTLEACAKTLLEIDRAHVATIKQKVSAPERYSLLKRLIGFYPLTAIPFARGIRKFQSEMTEKFSKDRNEVVSDADVVLHVAPPTQTIDVAAILQAASDNPLNIPLPNSEQLAQLFAQFAPNFAIDTRGNFDRPGAVGWSDDGRIHVNSSVLKIYTLASHTMFEGKALLQLNYAIWFSERPKKGKLDLLGGTLDGLIWRVTLAPNGEPQLYDTIHPCGCYHLFFPSDKLRAKPPHPSLQEHAYVPQVAPVLAPGERATIWVESASHYVVRVTATSPETTQPSASYDFADYDELRALPKLDGTHHSLFRPDGLIANTERGERLFFWPMGIASAGAMRQWGHHATAFVGKRHFDDADLIEKSFEAANKK